MIASLTTVSIRHLPRFGLAFVALFQFVTCSSARGDLVKLANGGEIRGRIIGGVGMRSTSDAVVLETLTGVSISIARADTKFLTMRPLNVEEYETRAKRIGDTLQEHWDLAEWCRLQGLSKQRELHLQRVVGHDPFHEKAQTALGRVWHEGNWVDRDEMMAARGYAKYKGRYVTIQELDLLQKSADELAMEREWFQKVRSWHGWLGGTNEDRYRRGLMSIKQIDDPHAAPAVIRFLCEDAKREMRALGVSVLSKLPGTKGAAGLVKLSLFDADDEIRFSAHSGIAQEDFEFAQNAYIRELRNSLNPVVCRAASALGRVGDQRAVAPLIDALVTTHRYEVQTNIPAVQAYSGSTDGTGGNFSLGTSLPPEVEIAMRTGQLPQGVVVAPPVGGIAIPRKTMIVSVEQPNHEALATLQKLTGQNYGFDERTWRLWWAAEKNATGGAAVSKK